MTSANERQIGGQHYASDLQHWDLVESYGLGYLEGCATKYVTRARKKNGLQDVLKAQHYVQKLLELHLEDNRRARGFVPREVLSEFSSANSLTSLESAIVTMLCRWENADQLRATMKDLLDLEMEYTP